MDPYHLHQNYQFELHESLGLFPINICLSNCFSSIRNGTIIGLSKMKRIGNGTFDNEGAALLANFTLGIDNITIYSNITFNFGSFQLFNLPVQSNVGNIEIKLVLAIQGKTIKVNYLRIGRINQVKLRFHPQQNVPNETKNGFIDFLTDLILTYFNKFVRKILSRALFTIISTEIVYMQSS